MAHLRLIELLFTERFINYQKFADDIIKDMMQWDKMNKEYEEDLYAEKDSEEASEIEVIPPTIKPIEQWPGQEKERQETIPEAIEEKETKTEEHQKGYNRKEIKDLPQNKKGILEKKHKRIKEYRRAIPQIIKSEKSRHIIKAKKEAKNHKSGKRTKRIKPKYPAIIAAIVLLAIILGITVWYVAKNQPVKEEGIAAAVNGYKITVKELDDAYARLSPDARFYLTESALLDQMIDQRILLQEAEKQGIAVSEEEAEAELNAQIDKTIFTKGQIGEKLKALNLTLEDVKKEIKDSLMINKLINKTIASEISISDKEAQGYYEQHTPEFTVSEKARIVYILVCSQDNPDCINNRTDAEAKALVAQLIQKIRAGEDAITLAKKYSDDPGAGTDSGDSGFRARREFLVKGIADLAFSLDINTIDFVRTDAGYYLVKVISKQPERIAPLSEVYAKIESDLLMQKQSNAFDLYLQQLRKNVDIKVYYNSNNSTFQKTVAPAVDSIQTE